MDLVRHLANVPVPFMIVAGKSCWEKDVETKNLLSLSANQYIVWISLLSFSNQLWRMRITNTHTQPHTWGFASRLFPEADNVSNNDDLFSSP